MSHEGTQNKLWQIYQFFNSKRIKEATFFIDFGNFFKNVQSAKGHLRKVKKWGPLKGVKSDQGQIINWANLVIYCGKLLVFRLI